MKWISLRHVSGKSDQLLIDLEAWSDIPLEALWSNQLFLARLVVMALNIATLGFFWFHEPLDEDERQSGRFWERLVNVETKEELRADRKPPLRLKFGKRRVLERADLSRWTLCLVHLMWGAADPGKREISARYLDGLAMIAKSDVHMAFEIQAVSAFYMALQAAMKAYEALEDEPFPVALRRFVSVAFKQTDDDGHLDRLIAVGESVNSGKPVPRAMDMNDVHVMKTICDVYLIRVFQKVGLPKRRTREASEDAANTQPS